MKIIQPLLFVATLLFGLVIAPVLKHITAPALETFEAITLSVLIILCLAFILSVHTLLMIRKTSLAETKETQKKIMHISESIGLSTLFLHEHNRVEGEDAYTIVQELVDSAEEEILILDHRPALDKSRYYDNTPPECDTRDIYYGTLLKKAKSRLSSNKHFTYKRIVQVDDTPFTKWDTAINGDRCFAAHVMEVVAFRESTPTTTSSIKTSRVFYPNSSILIVDSKRVLIEFSIIGPGGNSRVEGDLVFYDPDGKLAIPLRQLFEHIDGQSTLITKVI